MAPGNTNYIFTVVSGNLSEVIVGNNKRVLWPGTGLQTPVFNLRVRLLVFKYRSS